MLPPPPPPAPVPLDVSDADTERRLNSMCTRNPDRFFNNLLDIICSSAADSQRRFQAAVTLRHFFRLNSDLKSRLRDDTKAEEETRSLLEELRGAAIELGSYFLPDDSWPEFYSLMAAISPRVRVSALFIFSRLAHRIKWKSILPRLDLLRSLIRCSLNIKLSGEEVPYERNVALLAAITLIHIVPPSEDCQMLQDLLPDMISVLLEAFTGNQQEFAKEAVIRLTNLITVKPKFISPCLSNVLEAMLPEFDKVNKELRCEAVNLVVMLAKKEPVMVEQQLVPFLGGFVAILLEMLSDMKDDEDKDTGEENNLKYAKTFSNTLSAALGGDLLVPVLIKLLPGYLEDFDWKKRHAALFFLKEIAKGCVEMLKEHLGQIVKVMVASFKDKHPRVKWAALIAMRELLVDLKPDLEDQYHETIFPALLQAMKTFDHPHFQECTTWAAWKFMRWCSEDILKIYLNEMLDMLYTITTTQTGNRVVQDNALLILGYLATLQKERLGISYVESMYKYIMPKLKFCLKRNI
ncbi:uncharacterized protein LOC144546689 [Carex rostrata]